LTQWPSYSSWARVGFPLFRYGFAVDLRPLFLYDFRWHASHSENVNLEIVAPRFSVRDCFERFFVDLICMLHHPSGRVNLFETFGAFEVFRFLMLHQNLFAVEHPVAVVTENDCLLTFLLAPHFMF